MKKSRLAISILAASMIFAATSCHDNIYYLIEQEVPQQDGLEGDINSIVPFKGNLYTGNALIYRKTLSPSSTTGQYNYQWSQVSANDNAGNSILNNWTHLVSLAADDTYLYCYTVKIETNKEDAVNYPGTRTVYCSTNGETWTKVTESNNKVVLFDNQVGNGKTGSSTSGRKAYLLKHETNSEGTITATQLLSLNGSATPTDITASTNVVNATENANWITARAIKVNGSEKFINTTAATVNDAGTYAYYAKGSSVVCTNGDSNYDQTIELSSGPIWALAATGNYLLVGTTNGIYRTAILDNGQKVSSSVSDFGNNAQTLLTSHINCIYVLDSSLSEAGTDEYASLSILGPLSSAADSFKETGLYAFYPGRGNWNRDGDSSKKK